MQIIIVGGGIAGLAAAVGLTIKLKDCTVILVEKRSNWAEQGSTLGLAPNGRVALRELIAGAATDVVDLNALLQENGVPTSSEHDGLMLGWWQLRDGLLDILRASDQITFHLGYVLQSMEDTEEGVTATFSSSEENNDEILHIKGDILLGADGVNSMTRKCLGLPPAEFSGTHVWRGKMLVDLEEAAASKKSGDDNNNPHAILEPLLLKDGAASMFKLVGQTHVAIFNYHTKLPGVLTWVVATKDTVNKDGWVHIQDFFSKEAVGDDDMKILEALYEVSTTRELNHAMKLQTIPMLENCETEGYGGHGRVSLIGDACHALRPASGQGASMALEDVLVLCRIFEKKQKNGEEMNCRNDIEAALKEYETARIERVKRVWDYEWKVAEGSYKGERDQDEFTLYKDWLYAGI
mmetsp:Transcript_1848/g.2848  ORF Transcript_1848/g.2848 Transcript_1848/m.2848 type:complete len:408 (-) Transcript_1848:296-1519(-)